MSLHFQKENKVLYRNKYHYYFRQQKMLSKKSLLFVGLLLSGSLSFTPPGIQKKLVSPDNCDQEDMKKIIQLLDNDNPLCAKWDDDVCVKCATKSYFNGKGICVQVDPLCQDFDERASKCVSCYPGYGLENGKCIQQSKIKGKQNWTLSNPLCSVWKNKKCLRCSNKSFFNEQGICIMVNPDCRTHSQVNGRCTSCYDGYKLQNDGRCTRFSDDSLVLNNPLCSRWDRNGNCLECAPKSFRNKQGICLQVDPNCNTYSRQTGECFSCYGGFVIEKGQCVKQSVEVAASNPYCTNWSGRKCAKCATRTVMNSQGICVPVSPHCRTYSQKTGNCQSCYPGYRLSEGKCLEGQNNFNIQANPLCAQWQKDKCSKCSKRSYMNFDGVCVGVDPNCSTYNQKSGQCLTCYSGYQTEKGRCVASQSKNDFSQLVQRNPLCGEWKGQICVRCSPRSYFNEGGVCIQVDPYCQVFNEQKKMCTKCYSGYKLRKDLSGCSLPGSVQIQKPLPEVPNTVVGVTYDDPLCTSWETPYKCRKCAPGSNFNQNGRCKVHDPNCKNFNQQLRVCEECYGEFYAVQDKCVKVETPSNLDLDRCMVWRQGRCQQCARGLALNSTGSCACQGK